MGVTATPTLFCGRGRRTEDIHGHGVLVGPRRAALWRNNRSSIWSCGPNAPHGALVLTGGYSGVNDAGASMFASQLFQTLDDGASWAPYGTPLDPAATLETVEVSASDVHRVYVSGTREDLGVLKGVLFASDDDGGTWTEHPIPLDTNEHAPFIAAVDPSNSNRVYVRMEGDGGSRLLATDDGGASFRVAYLALGALLGFALSSDGSQVFIGGIDDGLLVAPAATLAFERRSTVHVRCLATGGSTLFACSDEATGFMVGASDDEGATFTPLLHLTTVRGPLPCATDASTTACAADWPGIESQLNGGSPTASDSGASAQNTVGDGVQGSTAAPVGSGCACGSSAGHGPGWAFAVGVVGVAWLRRSGGDPPPSPPRRQRPRRHRRPGRRSRHPRVDRREARKRPTASPSLMA